MIAVDTNILVYAHRSDSPWHQAATAALARLSATDWAITWPSVHEFLAIVTHPRIFSPPTPLEDAIRAVESWLGSQPVLLSEGEDHWPELLALVRGGKVVGPAVHDARIAALCLEHSVEELWTADRDFSRFPGLRTRNPLVGG